MNLPTHPQPLTKKKTEEKKKEKKTKKKTKKKHEKEKDEKAAEEEEEGKVDIPEELKMVFEQYDTDGSGNLGPDELERLLRDLDFDVDDIILSDILRRIDAGNDGEVDLPEMAVWWHEAQELMDHLIGALDSNDPDALEKAIRHGQRQVISFPGPLVSAFGGAFGSPNLIPNTDTFYIRSPL